MPHTSPSLLSFLLLKSRVPVANVRIYLFPHLALIFFIPSTKVLGEHLGIDYLFHFVTLSPPSLGGFTCIFGSMPPHSTHPLGQRALCPPTPPYDPSPFLLIYPFDLPDPTSFTTQPPLLRSPSTLQWPDHGWHLTRTIFYLCMLVFFSVGFSDTPRFSLPRIVRTQGMGESLEPHPGGCVLGFSIHLLQVVNFLRSSGPPPPPLLSPYTHLGSSTPNPNQPLLVFHLMDAPV